MIYLIGMGPGNIKYLTLDALEKIKSSSRIVAFGRLAKTVEELMRDTIKITKVEEVLKYIDSEETIAILASGDPCFYGLLEYLKNKNIEVNEVIPGISSFQYMMTKLKKSWHNAVFISLHGREENIKKVINADLAVILTDNKNNPHTISKTLYERGMKGKIYVGFNLSYEDEKIVSANIGEDIEILRDLSVVVIENEMD